MSGSSLREKAVNYLTIFLLLAIVAGGMALMYPDFKRSNALSRDNEELANDIDRRKQEIEKLKENQRRFRNDSDFVEMIARQNHRVFPGELIFIFDKN